jgi:hypothetical protein
VQPSTIFCSILHVLPSSTAPGYYWAVMLADPQGVSKIGPVAHHPLEAVLRYLHPLPHRIRTAERFAMNPCHQTVG